MKTFKNKKTGVLEHVTNKKLIAQYEKYTNVYELVEEKNKEQKQTLSELKEKAEELGVDFNNKTTKAELVELINNETN